MDAGLQLVLVQDALELALGELGLHRVEAGARFDNLARSACSRKRASRASACCASTCSSVATGATRYLFERMRPTREPAAVSPHEVAPELIGAELYVDGVGGMIVEVEAYDHEDPAAHGYRNRRTAAQRVDVPARRVTRTSTARTASTGA